MQKLLNESLLQSHIILSNCEDIEYTIYQNNPSRLFWQNRNTFNAIMSTMYGMNIVTIIGSPESKTLFHTDYQFTRVQQNLDICILVLNYIVLVKKKTHGILYDTYNIVSICIVTYINKKI